MADAFGSIFRRQCVECPPTIPTCPTCPSGQVCSFTTQSCQQCARASCVASGITTGSGVKSGPNVGAIAGGVVGGVVLVAIVTFLVWRFFIRDRRRQQHYEEEWEEDDVTTAKTQFREHRDTRASIHTVHSVASTMLSRASNMIPIAFIPGVMNRDGTLNTPPVPPIPAARNHTASPTSRHDQGDIIFMPNDLRNSAYSATSSLNNRDTHYGRPSLTPSLARSSVTSEVYRDDAAANPMPATTVMRVRPNMVSVKTNGSSPVDSQSGIATPVAFSERDFAEGRQPQVLIPGSSGPVSSASGSLHSNASFGRPTPVTIVKNGKGRFPVRNVSDASTARSDGGPKRPAVSSPLANATDDSSDEEEDSHARARKSLLNPNRESSATTIQDTPDSMQGPFADSAGATPRAQKRETSGGLSAVIEEATRRASRVPTHNGLGGRESSPFGDEHALG